MSDVKQFHENVRLGDIDAVRAAVAANPELLDAKNDAGQNAILLAKYYGQADTANYLLSLGPNLDVFTAAAAGKQEIVLRDIERDPTLLEAKSGDGWTVLHLAAFFGYPELVTALIEKSAEIDARSGNAMQNTPLHAGVAGRKAEAVRALLENPAGRKPDVNARQHGGWTPLHGAAQNGDRAIVELLIANGADMNARAENNQSALDLALTRGHHEIVALLEELGAKLS
ncbi:MAG TPA: ankyrin repeat domain-containing protein [Bryobacteraceae bacterium]|jgi:ankyrin repeat protein|nr:ankyrin repeat domain-containing protein [Bryobacteraceae bacterium]